MSGYVRSSVYERREETGICGVWRWIKNNIKLNICIGLDLLMIQGDGLPRLTVNPDCKNTINEFESYIWKPNKDEPVKENDHAMDAIRYGYLGLDAGRVSAVADPFAAW